MKISLGITFLALSMVAPAEVIMAERSNLDHFDRVEIVADSAERVQVEALPGVSGSVGCSLPSSFSGKKALIQVDLDLIRGRCLVAALQNGKLVNASSPILKPGHYRAKLWLDLPTNLEASPVVAAVYVLQDSEVGVRWIQVKSHEHQAPPKDSRPDEHIEIQKGRSKK